MARMKKVREESDGWSKWQSPMMNRKYRLACCDCGLVHNIVFRVVKQVWRRGKDWRAEPVRGMKVQFKAQRNNRSTALVRRAKGK